MNLAICVKKDKKNVVTSGLTVLKNKYKDKGKNVNSLLKRNCDEDRIVFGDNSNIIASMCDYSGLHLILRGTTLPVNNLCSS